MVSGAVMTPPRPPKVAADGLRFRGVVTGDVAGEADCLAACAKKVVQVDGVISGPASSSMLLELALLPSFLPRYTLTPIVEGRPNSRAMATNMAPRVGCRGMRRPLLHRRRRSRSVAGSSPATDASNRGGGITATTCDGGTSGRKDMGLRGDIGERGLHSAERGEPVNVA